MYRISLLLLALLAATAGYAAPPEIPPGLSGDVDVRRYPERVELQPLDVGSLLAEDIKREARGAPPRYAVAKAIEPVSPSTHGTWTTLKDGSRLWRYAIQAEGATSIEAGFTQFHLPEGAALYVYGDNGKRIRGPFTAQDNEKHGQLWVPIVEGDTAIIELVLQPRVALSDVELKLTNVLQGYWEFWKTGALKSGACNVDVACEAANGWEDQIQSVARITVGGNLCTGQLIANTTGDDRPLFLTAHHCGGLDDVFSQSDAAATTVYWNYESPICRAPGSAASGDDGGGSLDQAQSGADLLADYVSTDFTLLQLDEAPKPEYNVYWTGWDRRDMTFDGGTGIHHPAGDEKRISFEEDRLVIVDGDETSGLLDADESIPRSHLQVTDWDLGTTEGGSSGSGLWNPQHRLIGQLHGGLAACGNNDPDWYGRLAASWTGGGTSDSSLVSWLDPTGTGEKFIDGYYACGLEAFEIQVEPASPKIGQTVTLTAVAPAGANLGDFTLSWDIDGDGLTDGNGASINTRYTKAFDGQVSLSVSDNVQECTRFTKFISVKAPVIELVNIGNATEACGDGDLNMEPGEHWELPITLSNTGDVHANDVQAVFTRAGASEDELSVGGPDDFGYTFADSSAASCPYQFTDISSQDEPLPFNDAVPNNTPANDDGATDAISLNNFGFYGRNVNAVVMASNGYLATSAARNGGDYTNDCPLPMAPDIDPGSARLAVFHDDLIIGDAYSKHFNDCPRPPDTPDASGACRVFQWSDVGLIRNGPPFDELDVPHFEFQAILYEGSNQIVYQYGPKAPQVDASPTVGIQNDPATDGLTYACESLPLARPAGPSAVCFFHPQSSQIQPDEVNIDGVHLDTPALDFGNIPIGAERSATLEFTVDADAACGDVIGIKLHGFVFEGGFSAGPGLILSERVGGPDEQCSSSASCPAAKADSIAFNQGLWLNPQREGHGADVSINSSNGVGAFTWYTYDNARSPTWYQTATSYQDNQIHGDLFRFTWDGNSATGEDVGELIFTVLGKNKALFNWTLNGEKGGEVFVPLTFSNQPPSGLWFPPSQEGWGFTVTDQGNLESAVLFIYDNAGQPVWALGVASDPSNNPTQVLLHQFTGTCPGCPWVKQSGVEVGSLTRSFSNGSGTVSTDVTLKPPLEGDWNKNQVTIERLTGPGG